MRGTDGAGAPEWNLGAETKTLPRPPGVEGTGSVSSEHRAALGAEYGEAGLC